MPKLVLGGLEEKVMVGRIPAGKILATGFRRGVIHEICSLLISVGLSLGTMKERCTGDTWATIITDVCLESSYREHYSGV